MALYPARNVNSGRPFNCLALCAGFGGLELGLSIAEPDHRTVCFVEREAYPAATLVARMEDQTMGHAPVWSDLKTFDGRPWRGKVDILTAGYPCQPFTVSGHRKGASDSRHLWPDVARVIKQVRPQWVFCENVEGHLSLGFPEVARELQSLGFDVKAGLFSAYEVGAGHQRRRLFMLAHANCPNERQSCRAGVQEQRYVLATQTWHQRVSDWLTRSRARMDAAVVDIKSRRVQSTYTANDLPIFAPSPSDFTTWHKSLERRADLQPAFFGLANGVANRMERSKAAGNGVVPLAAALAYSTLKQAFKDG